MPGGSLFGYRLAWNMAAAAIIDFDIFRQKGVGAANKGYFTARAKNRLTAECAYQRTFWHGGNYLRLQLRTGKLIK